jgi:predicted transposase YbfD/YdcC
VYRRHWKKNVATTHEETHVGHGRIDYRRIEVVPAGHVQWPGLKQWGRITRTRTDKKTGVIAREEVCFISSLGQSQAMPAELLAYNRNHWSIENRFHRNKDTLLREDASTVRTGGAPQALAALGNFTLRLLAGFDPSPTIAREIAQNDRNNVIQMLT